MRPFPALRLLPVLLLLPLLTACGITFGETSEGTELLKKVSVAGEFVAGGELTVTMELNETYPVPVHVACFVENESLVTKQQKEIAFHERATLIGEETIDAVIDADLTPGDDVKRREVSYRFRPERPGLYFVACITPAAPDNGIGREFHVRGGLE